MSMRKNLIQLQKAAGAVGLMMCLSAAQCGETFSPISVRGIVKNAAGNPISGAIVSLKPSTSGGCCTVGEACTTTSSTVGKWEVSYLGGPGCVSPAAASCEYTVTAQGYASKTLSFQQQNSCDSIGNLEITLEP